MKIIQLKDAYRYNTDSLITYDFASKFIKNRANVLDVGCGCGIIGLLLARDFNISLDMVDFQSINTDIASLNAKNNSIKADIICENFINLKVHKKYDFIVSNPPFYNSKSTKSQSIHKAKSRYEEYLPLKEFLKKSNSLLKPKGELLFCYDPMFLSVILESFRDLKLILKNIKFIHAKKDKDANLVLLRAKKSAATSTVIMPPTFIHNENEYSAEIKRLYTKADLISQDTTQAELLNLIDEKKSNLITKSGFDYSFNPDACGECKGKCCTGESGYIWVTGDEISQIAGYLNLNKDTLVNEFCEVYSNKISIKEKPYKDGFSCVFFNESINGCSIYPVRPAQCKSFPFWEHFKTHKCELKKECMGVIFDNKERV